MEFADDMMQSIEEYCQKKINKVDRIVNKETLQCKRDLNEISPYMSDADRIRKAPKRVGLAHYKDSWVKTKVTEGSGFYAHKSYIVRNKFYTMVHLLENGHNIVRNGVVVGRVPPKKHVSIAEESAKRRIEEEVDKLK